MITEKLINLLYPRRCPVCFDIVLSDEGKVHHECREKLEIIKEPYCLKCGKPIRDDQKEYCMDCTNHRHTYNYGKALWIYNDAVRESIYAYKYKGKKEYAQFYIDEVLRHCGGWIKELQPEALIPVPLSKKKYRQRGYNQAEIIARGISEACHIPLDCKMLIRSRHTQPQKELSVRERLHNLQKAFSINPRSQKAYQCVLLIDDIYTTGSTVEACAKILKKAGVSKVCFLSLCIGEGY